MTLARTSNNCLNWFKLAFFLFKFIYCLLLNTENLNYYCRYHAIGSRSEITAACLVSLMCKIWHGKLCNINGMELIDSEENCKQWFLAVDPCSCHIEAKPPLKPIQLFLGNIKYN